MEATCTYVVALLAIFLGVAIAEDDEWMECMIHEVCIEKSGFHNTMGCFNRLGMGDKKHMLEFFSKHYEDKFEEIMKLLEKACSNTDEAKVAIDEYYDERQSEQTSREVTPEDEKMLVDARNCMLSMVEDCELKKKMGVI